MNPIRAGVVQMEHAPRDKDANFRKIERFAAEAARRGVKLLAFPECCITGYWFIRNLTRAELEALAEPVPAGPSGQRLLSLSRAHGMTIGAGLVERADDGTLYNTYLIAMPDGAWRRHRKIHAFEHEFIAPGSEFTVFDTPHGCRVGALICYDVNLAENVRINALQGVEVLFAPHQTGGCRSSDPNIMGLVERRLWEERHRNPAAIEAEFRGHKGRGWLMRWLPTRAYENGIFLLFSNGVGIDDDEVRTGNAMIIDPHGNILAESGKADDDLVVADLDPALIAASVGQKHMRSRRPDLYEPLVRRYGNELDTRTVRLSIK